MPLVPRNALPAKVSGSSKKEHSIPSEKENELPSATAAVRKCKQIGLRRRVSLCSNDDRRKESIGTVGRQGPAIGETFFTSRKTPFHVHCDEKNVPESQPRSQQLLPHPRSQPQPEPQPQSSASSHDHRNERKQPAAPGLEQRDRVSRKPLADNESRRNDNVLPSKIPRRARSVSSSSNTRKARSRDDKNGLSLQTISIARTSSNVVEGVNAARRAIIDRTYRVDRVLASSTLQGNGIGSIGSIGSIDRRLRSRDGREESPSTPASACSPETFVVDRAETTKRPARVGATKAPISLPGALNCNAEYHADLPIAEREKEERAPRLSASFLGGHVNVDQRKVIVAYMFHLGTHCRYPSHVVYRAVKLFDAAIDRLEVDTVLIQLTALASLWIALKTLENSHRIPTASTMVSLAKDLYAGREDLLIDYERKILRALDFNVTFADAHSLLSYHLINFKRCAAISDEMFMFVYHAGCYAIDVTLLDDRFCQTSASLVTVTAAELVLGLVVDTEQARATDGFARCQIRPRWLFWRGFLYAAAASVTAAGSRFGARFQDEEIDRCRVTMLRCVLNSGRKKHGFEVVYKKYSRSRFGRIAESFLDRAGMLSPLETFDP